MDKGTTYAVTVSTGIRNIMGVSLAAEVRWNFTTGNTDNYDLCPDDPAKTAPGICSRGVPDTRAETYYRDQDGDGFGDPLFQIIASQPPAGYVTDNTDCDDTNPSVKPGAAENCPAISAQRYYFPSIKENNLISWENYLETQARDPISMEVTVKVYAMKGDLLGTYIIRISFRW